MRQAGLPSYDGTVLTGKSYVVGGQVDFSAAIPLDTSVRISTNDASGDQIREGIDYSAINEQKLFPVAGQYYVDGVRSGDLVAIDVEEISAAAVGHCWTRPGIGFAAPGGFAVHRVNVDDPWLPVGNDRVKLSKRPHIGTLGAAPAAPRPARDLGQYGGNIDTPRLGAGATLWLKAEQDGLGLFAGDVHVSIADGEICGTGIEVPATVQLRVRRVEAEPPPLPVVSTADGTWAIGIGRTLDEALLVAVQYAIKRVGSLLGASGTDAYLAVAQLLDVEVCQVANPQRSIAISLRSGMDWVLRPSTDSAVAARAARTEASNV